MNRILLPKWTCNALSMFYQYTDKIRPRSNKTFFPSSYEAEKQDGTKIGVPPLTKWDDSVVYCISPSAHTGF